MLSHTPGFIATFVTLIRRYVAQKVRIKKWHERCVTRATTCVLVLHANEKNNDY